MNNLTFNLISQIRHQYENNEYIIDFLIINEFVFILYRQVDLRKINKVIKDKIFFKKYRIDNNNLVFIQQFEIDICNFAVLGSAKSCSFILLIIIDLYLI